VFCRDGEFAVLLGCVESELLLVFWRSGGVEGEFDFELNGRVRLLPASFGGEVFFFLLFLSLLPPPPPLPKRFIACIFGLLFGEGGRIQPVESY
jgi:hypothetical protein